MSKKSIHTAKRGDSWANVREGGSRASSTHSTQADAAKAAREQARQDQVEHFIHGRDGKIRERNSYGNDPHPPKG